MLRKSLLNAILVWCLFTLGQARQEGTVEECEKNIPASLKGRICELRQYTPVQGKDMDAHMQCVLEVVGFVEDNGELAFQELLGVLKMVDPTMDHAGNLKKCDAEAKKVDSSSKANAFYTCFLGTSSVQAFKYAVDYAELVRAGKLDSGAPFDADCVSRLMKEIDDGICN
uniref:Short form D7 salivary protein n=1 Tax=Anopheles epiroticus TaxID=199890 RepID=A0A240PL02_9DIPT